MDHAFLKIKSGSGVRQIPFVGHRVTIGRHKDNTLPLADSLASRFHCVVEKTDAGFMLHDLQSRNGTLLNGSRVMSSPLTPEDVITVGQTQVTLLILGKVPKKGTTAQGNGKNSTGGFKRTAGRGRTPAPDKKIPASEEAKPEIELEVLGEQDLADELDVLEDSGAPVELVGDADGSGQAAIEKLRAMADALPQQDFEVDAIELINTRGKPHMEPGSTAANSENVRENVMIFRLVLLLCFRSHASDIHLEPRAEEFLMRLRVDGNLVDLARLSRELGGKIAALAKVLCDLDTTQRTIVQEGHFAARAPLPPKPGEQGTAAKLRRVDYRVSFVPTLYGQKMVIRTFDSANAPLLLDDLQLPQRMAEDINKQLSLATGVILVCGPTGSGKTTTLYSLLRTCGTGFRNILTIEDPVEVQIEGTTQLPVDEEAGKTFANLLRSSLRQDPDVMMVGEIRDAETARIALQASITGHMVLSTVHTRDSVGSIFRLLDLGIEPYMIAQGLHLVIAQRLARKLCLSCRRPFAPSAEDRAKLGSAGEGVRTLYAPKGCPTCLGSGFSGRRAVFEMLTVSHALRERITRNPQPAEIRELATQEGFVSLLQSGNQLVADGITSLDEIDRAIG
jgi:type II secretory ATPase GspE/PulE/Tfp pilus assembly ATPase PilB-like protein